MKLHVAVAAALAVTEFRPEARPFRPHLTLARCEPGTSPSAIEEFLRTHADFAMRGVYVDTFGLYSSTRVAGVPVYRCEWTFALKR